MKSSWRQSERISCKPRESKAKIRSKTSNFNCMHIPNQLVCVFVSEYEYAQSSDGGDGRGVRGNNQITTQDKRGAGGKGGVRGR